MSRQPTGDEIAGVLSPGIVAEGRFVFISGQGPLREGVYEPATLTEETQLVLENLRTRLFEAGTDLAHVVRVGVFLTDLDDLGPMNEVYAAFFPSPKPARTTIQAAALPGGIKIEVDCVAVCPQA